MQKCLVFSAKRQLYVICKPWRKQQFDELIDSKMAGFWTYTIIKAFKLLKLSDWIVENRQKRYFE